MRPSYAYKITDIQSTGGALAIEMSPKEAALRPAPGQFGVLRFAGAGKDEPHPFSFSRISEEGTLRVTIKPLGDFTSGLGTAVRLGQDVYIQGPFGRFRHSGKTPEVWISGGIGVTPFLAWAHALAHDAAQVDLFYCIRSRDEAPHLEELEALAAAKPNLVLHTTVSGEGQRLSAALIAEHVLGDLSKMRVSFCGPVSLRESLRTGLSRFGVNSRNFQYEEFEFRTGIGLKSLAEWILSRKDTAILDIGMIRKSRR